MLGHSPGPAYDAGVPPPDLRLVTPPPLDATGKAKQRLRELKPRDTGTLQCPECGSLSVCAVRAGVVVTEKGRTPGTVRIKDVCDDCRRTRKRLVDMIPSGSKPKPAR